jgi:hypothetical protein
MNRRKFVLSSAVALFSSALAKDIAKVEPAARSLDGAKVEAVMTRNRAAVEAFLRRHLMSNNQTQNIYEFRPEYAVPHVLTAVRYANLAFARHIKKCPECMAYDVQREARLCGKRRKPISASLCTVGAKRFDDLKRVSAVLASWVDV